MGVGCQRLLTGALLAGIGEILGLTKSQAASGAEYMEHAIGFLLRYGNDGANCVPGDAGSLRLIVRRQVDEVVIPLAGISVHPPLPLTAETFSLRLCRT